jgi:hypothetical protein
MKCKFKHDCFNTTHDQFYERKKCQSFLEDILQIFCTFLVYLKHKCPFQLQENILDFLIIILPDLLVIEKSKIFTVVTYTVPII